jgi:hypothetical protein
MEGFLTVSLPLSEPKRLHVSTGCLVADSPLNRAADFTVMPLHKPSCTGATFIRALEPTDGWGAP